MKGFDILKRDKRLLLSNNLFSVPCTLTNTQNNQSQDDLKCLGDFVGIQLDGNGNSIINDSSEAVINFDDVRIGKIESGWTLSFIQGGTDEIIDFKIDYVMEDKTTGIYKLKLSLLKKKSNEEQYNSINQPNIKPNTLPRLTRRNGGI